MHRAGTEATAQALKPPYWHGDHRTGTESSKGAVLGGLGPQTAKTAPLEDSGAAAAAAAKLEMSRGA